MSRGIDVSGLGDQELAALRRTLEQPKYELIPLKNVMEEAGYLPPGATVSVTASPAKGMDATIDLTLDLKEQGFRAIPHLSARLTPSRAELEKMLARLDEAGVDRAFVVGGDGEQTGEFFDGLSLLTAMEEIGHGLVEIGVPAYPEGHHVVDDETMDRALEEKLPYVSYLTSQMCFLPDAISGWVERLRDSGIGLGVYLGVPGVAELRKLLQLSVRIGVGRSQQFLAKTKGLAGRLVRPGGYSPDTLLLGLAPLLADPTANILGLHIYTFNQVETTEQWRQEMLEQLTAVRAPEAKECR